jgi:hypothetical protein
MHSSEFSGLPIPAFVRNGELSLTIEDGSGPYPVVLCTVPKAGTYLISELLAQLGLAATRLHLSANELTDYRFATRRSARDEWTHYIRPVHVERAAPLIRPGQFAVGHIPCGPRFVKALHACRVLYAYRDLRDACVSFMRFLADTERSPTVTWKRMPNGPDKMLRFLETDGCHFFDHTLNSLGWRHLALPIRFETLIGDDGPGAREALIRLIAGYVGITELPKSEAEIIQSAMAAQTMTKTDRRTDRSVFWSDEVEAEFCRRGGADANIALGYGR